MEPNTHWLFSQNKNDELFTWINNRVLTWETCWELITWINKAANYEQNNKCLSHTVHKHLLLIAMHCIAWCVKQLVHVWSIISAKCRNLKQSSKFIVVIITFCYKIMLQVTQWCVWASFILCFLHSFIQ